MTEDQIARAIYEVAPIIDGDRRFPGPMRRYEVVEMGEDERFRRLARALLRLLVETCERHL